jgi:serine/threonine protein kinase
MPSERWQHIERIYAEALERAPEDRRSFLESSCGEDEMLKREVERLLTANDKAGGFLDSPAWNLAADTVGASAAMAEPGRSLVGRTVASYSILEPLGAGGMGEVYRARDSKLNREVALKVLPELLALDAGRLARFRREAHLLASLNHPNIAAIYGFEDAGDVHALVLELVEGPTLADRIARGPVALDEALPMARQIADALEAAHERGIVHRDLKPANIKVRADGVVKVLDFGLARAFEIQPVAMAATQSPTGPNPVTADGIIVGTPAYMAPEQARGKAADKRADLWAFGCVLYELLTGRRVFAGQDTSETLAAVIRDNPDWRALPNDTPPSIGRLLRRCLAKDPKGRLSDAAAARLEIDDAFAEPRIVTEATPSTSPRTERFAWAFVLLLVVVAAVAVVMLTRRPESPGGEVRFEIPTPPTTDAGSLAISPDGQKIVFVATSAGHSMLWLRRLDSLSSHPLPGTEGATAPFWSPDSRSVAFFTSMDNRLKRLDIDGRAVQVLGTVPLGTGGTWNRDGVILFSTLSGPGPLLRVSSDGGQASPVTQLTAPEATHQFPQFLPDGRRFLYHVPNLSPPAVFIGDLDGSASRRLFEADTPALYVPSGYVLFVREGTLFAQAVDPDTVEVTGNPLRVADLVATVSVPPVVSVSATGTLVYRAGPPGDAIPYGTRPLVWFDRSGREIARVGGPFPGTRPALARDGHQVAFMRSVDSTSPPDIWILALDRNVVSRVTSNAAINLDPIWSPDGREIVFSASLKGSFDLYRRRVDGTGADNLLLATPEPKMPSDWSSDGRFLLYTTFFGSMSTATDIWSLPLVGDRKPIQIVQTAFEERDAQFSPDGRWIAYQSNETGQFEIYLQQFPGPGRRQPVSTAGGAQVRWRRDGRELFYVALDGKLMAVPIRFTPDSQSVDVGTPVSLFTTQVGGAVLGLDRQQYVVSPDGQRFLMSILPEDANPSPITVVLNFQPGPQN